MSDSDPVLNIYRITPFTVYQENEVVIESVQYSTSNQALWETFIQNLVDIQRSVQRSGTPSW